MRRPRRSHWTMLVTWTQWALPLRIWWWPVRPNRAAGAQVGPVHLQWEERGTS